MKTLLLFCNSFGYTPTEKTLDFVPVAGESKQHNHVQTLFIHLEKEDEKKEASMFKKLVIHSFAHLSESKADPEFSMHFLNRLEERMSAAGIEACQTPFGYFLDLHMDAPGFSQARVFKQF